MSHTERPEPSDEPAEPAEPDEPVAVPLPDEATLGVLADVAARIAAEAGALVRDGRRAWPGRVEVAATKSSATDVVTAMDLAAETLLRRRLAELRPDDGILGEEEGLAAGTSGISWVLDPVDGTVNYLYGIPAYAVSVGAVVGPVDPAGWTVVAAAVHTVADGRTFVATRGRGAFVDGRRLRVGDGVPLAEALVGTGFGYTVGRRTAQARVVARVLPLVRDIRRIGSSAVDLCLLAEGSLDLYYERGLQPWDLAAASLVAAEAGAFVGGLRGLPATDEMTVAGPPAAARELVGLLERLGADSDETPPEDEAAGPL